MACTSPSGDRCTRSSVQTLVRAKPCIGLLVPCAASNSAAFQRGAEPREQHRNAAANGLAGRERRPWRQVKDWALPVRRPACEVRAVKVDSPRNLPASPRASRPSRDDLRGTRRGRGRRSVRSGRQASASFSRRRVAPLFSAICKILKRRRLAHFMLLKSSPETTYGQNIHSIGLTHASSEDAYGVAFSAAVTLFRRRLPASPWLGMRPTSRIPVQEKYHANFICLRFQLLTPGSHLTAFWRPAP